MKKKLQGALMMVLWMLLGGICGVYIGKFIDQSGLYEKSFGEILFYGAAMIVALYVFMYLQIILHEGGHFLFGLLTGYRFSSFRIGSFILIREDGKFKIKRYSLAGTGGQCLMEPPELIDGMMPVFLYNMGGSILNLLAGILSFMAAGIFFKGMAAVVFNMMGIVAIGFGLMNGIPMKLGEVNNDGHNAFSLGKDKKAVRAFWIQLMMSSLTSKGIRMKDMPDDWFEIPDDEGMKNSLIASLGVFKCNQLMDRMEFEEADRLMEQLLSVEKSGVIGLHRNLLICDRIYCELIGENRREIIDSYLSKEQKKFMKSMKNYPSVIRTEYGLAVLHEKNGEKAEKVMKHFEKIEKTYPYPCEIEGEKELMSFLLNH